MKKIAITGTIASGKSTIVEVLKQLGYPVFNADQIAKEVYQKEQSSFLKIVELFGDEILDINSEIDYQKVSKLIFNNVSLRLKLNHIIHPYVLNRLYSFFQEYQEKSLVFAEVPLLYEVGWEVEFDYVIVIYADKETTITRMMENRGYSYQEAIERIKAQFPAKIKMEKADFLIYNNTSKQVCLKQLYDILEKL